MDVVIVSSEVAPFSKTGGMGDVTGALAAALHRAGHRVMAISPRYGSIHEDLVDTGVVARAFLGQSEQTARLLRLNREGPTYVFVDHPVFSGRDGIYGDHNGGFGDNHIRFTLLQRAALEAARKVKVGDTLLGDTPVFHVHDWQTASLPVVLDHFYRPLGMFRRSPVVLTVHNPAHQGRLPAAFFDDLDLPTHWFSPGAFEWHGDLALLKCGLLRADQLTTVSPSFAWDVTTRSGGFGLDAIFRGRYSEMTGILNGIDTEIWDPATDPHTEAPYTADDLAGKKLCKRSLQEELGLPPTEGPLFGSVGRLDPQKGVSLLIDSIPWLVAQGAQVVVLGSAAAAHKDYEHQLRVLERRFPLSVRAWIGFSERVAHRIEAGADFFMMPSLFEPCGLNQMYSQRYGTLPVVRRTGGLADSVVDGQTGFCFDAPTGIAFRDALFRALQAYHTDVHIPMRVQAMNQDLGWDTVLPAYLDVYETALTSRARLVGAQ